MLGHDFYHGTIRKYVILFGTLFNDIKVFRENSDGSKTQTLKVPITYAPADKVLARVTDDPQLNKDVAIQLPRMSFEITAYNYDPTRKLNSVLRNVYASSGNDYLKKQYSPVPYDIDFELNIMVKNAEDGTRILEQILPFFTPEWTATMDIIPEMDIKLDIPLVLTSMSVNDDYEADFLTRRALTTTINFTLKGYLFGPVREAKIIKIANTNFYVPSTNTAAQGVSNTPRAEALTVQPGLLANGSPTTNVAASVAVSEINASDDFGFAQTIYNDLVATDE